MFKYVNAILKILKNPKICSLWNASLSMSKNVATIIKFESLLAIEYLIFCTSVFFIVLHEAEELNSCALFGRTYEQLDVGFDTRLDSEIRFSPVGASCIF